MHVGTYHHTLDTPSLMQNSRDRKGEWDRLVWTDSHREPAGEVWTVVGLQQSKWRVEWGLGAHLPPWQLPLLASLALKASALKSELAEHHHIRERWVLWSIATVHTAFSRCTSVTWTVCHVLHDDAQRPRWLWFMNWAVLCLGLKNSAAMRLIW